MQSSTSPSAVDAVIAGGGPAGVVLGLLLARAGRTVVVLEKHADFLRDFRGDTIHPSTLETLEQIGLADRFLLLPHVEARSFTFHTDGRVLTIPFDHLRTRFRFVAFVPQWDFLDFLAREARQYPGFDLRMSAEVTDLLVEDGVVRGAVYRDRSGERHEVRARLTVGADGRDSRTRALLGLPIVATSPPIDVLWFRLSRRPEDPRGPSLRLGAGQIVVAFDRATHWQVAQVVGKGEMADAERVRIAVGDLVPWLADRVDEITDGGIRRLTVRSDRLRRWYAPGYLAIGDAAHAMSPIGGVGINVAIQDAVVAANVLCAPLALGRVTEADLRRVQRRRVLQVRLLQALQGTVHRRVLAPTLNGRWEVGARILRVAGALRRPLARLVALGPFRPRVRTPYAPRDAG